MSVDTSLADHTVVITGGNSGIGLWTAQALAARGATVIFAGRSEEKNLAAIADIQRATGNTRLEFLPCDLGSLQSVRAAADTFAASGRPLHTLINNAGLGGGGGVTVDGFELAFGTNHLGHFLLTERLRPLLVDKGRVVNVASTMHYRVGGIDFGVLRAHTRGFKGMAEYGVSKLCNVLHASSLAEQFAAAGRGQLAFSLHPGVIASNIWARPLGPFAPIVRLFMTSPEDGARTSVHCATAPGIEGESGGYFERERPKKPSRAARDPALREALWHYSVEAVAPFLR
jgi:dehydrogenase/reductase SDR family protein 13